MMNHQKSKFSLIFRIISLVLVQAFLVMDFAWAGSVNLSPQVQLSLDSIKAIFITAPLLTETEMLLDTTIKDIHQHVQIRPFIERSKVENYLSADKIAQYFHTDAQAPGLLYFPNDFLEKRIIWERDIAIRKQLIALYDQAHSYNKRLDSIISYLIKRSDKKYLFDKMLAELSDVQTKIETRVFIALALANKWKLGLGEKRLGILLNELVNIYKKTSSDRLRSKVIRAIFALSKNPEISVYAHKAVIDIVKDDLYANIARFSAMGKVLIKADERYALALEYKEYYSQQQLYYYRRQGARIVKMQEEVMAEIDRAINIAMNLAEKAQTSKTFADIQVSEDLLKYLINLADLGDASIKSTVYSGLMRLLKDDNKTVENFYSQKIQALMPSDLFKSFNAIFVSQSEKIRVDDIFAVLQNKELPERAGYVLLFRHQSKSLLERVIFSKEINIKFRLYAFSYYAAKFLVKKASGMTDLDKENKLKEMQGVLEDSAKVYLKSAVKDNSRIKALIDDVWLQNEELKMYITAVTVVLQKKTKLLSAKSYPTILDTITSAKVLDYLDNANGLFNIGGRLFKNDNEGTQFFLQVIAHELMHNILNEEYGYVTSDLVHSLAHEFLSDLFEFVLLETIEVDPKDHIDAVKNDILLANVRNDSYCTVEGHEGAKAQWKIIKDRFARFNLKIDFFKLLQSGILVVTAKENEKDQWDSIVKKILECYEGIYMPQARISGEEDGELYQIVINPFFKAKQASDKFKQQILTQNLIDPYLERIKSQFDETVRLGLLIAQGI